MKIIAVILTGLAICSCTFVSQQTPFFPVSSKLSFPWAPAPDHARAAFFPAPAPQVAVNPLPPQVIDPIIRQAAEKNNVRASLVKGIVAAESQFHPNVVSDKGALGLMQLMPATAHQYGANAMDPQQNINAGTRYLRVLLNHYSCYRNCLTRTIAAYNAGPTVVDRYHGVPPFKETRNYVVRVLSYMHQYQSNRGRI